MADPVSFTGTQLFLEVSDHAGDRMRARGIKEEDVQYALRNHEDSYITKGGDVVYIGPGKQGQKIKVRTRNATASYAYIVDTLILR